MNKKLSVPTYSLLGSGVLKAKNEEKIRTIMKRKEEHINICLNKPVQARKVKTLFDCVHLMNESLPEIDFDEIDTSVRFLGQDFSAPIMAGAITGGAELAEKINKNIAMAVEELRLGMVLGSQRAALYDKRLERTYSVAREFAPTAFIGSNVGGAQLAAGMSIADCKKLVKMLDANAFYVHLNPLQEVLQPEGEPKYKKVLSKIEDIAGAMDVPGGRERGWMRHLGKGRQAPREGRSQGNRGGGAEGPAIRQWSTTGRKIWACA